MVLICYCGNQAQSDVDIFYLRHMTELKACTVASLYQKVWLLRAH